MGKGFANMARESHKAVSSSWYARCCNAWLNASKSESSLHFCNAYATKRAQHAYPETR